MKKKDIFIGISYGHNATVAVIPVVSMFARFKPITVVCVPVGHTYMVWAEVPIDPLVLTLKLFGISNPIYPNAIAITMASPWILSDVASLPSASGNCKTLSAVGLTTVRVVSCASATDPSNMILPEVAISLSSTDKSLKFLTWLLEFL